MIIEQHSQIKYRVRGHANYLYSISFARTLLKRSPKCSKLINIISGYNVSALNRVFVSYRCSPFVRSSAMTRVSLQISSLVKHANLLLNESIHFMA
jgi:hypothetical protein